MLWRKDYDDITGWVRGCCDCLLVASCLFRLFINNHEQRTPRPTNNHEQRTPTPTQPRQTFHNVGGEGTKDDPSNPNIYTSLLFRHSNHLSSDCGIRYSDARHSNVWIHYSWGGNSCRHHQILFITSWWAHSFSLLLELLPLNQKFDPYFNFRGRNWRCPS